MQELQLEKTARQKAQSKRAKSLIYVFTIFLDDTHYQVRISRNKINTRRRLPMQTLRSSMPHTERDGHEFHVDFPKLIHRYAAQKTRLCRTVSAGQGLGGSRSCGLDGTSKSRRTLPIEFDCMRS